MNPDTTKAHQDKTYILPVIPLNGKFVIFPRGNQKLTIASKIATLATESAINIERLALLLNPKEIEKENLGPDDFQRVGTVASITKDSEQSDGTIEIVVEGESRAIVLRCFERNQFLQAEVNVVRDEPDESKQARSLIGVATTSFEKYTSNKEIRVKILERVKREEDPGPLADMIAQFLSDESNILPERLQQVLNETTPIKRLQIVIELLEEAVELIELEEKIEEKINQQVHKSLQKTHKEFYLQERMKVIQKELGRGDEQAEIDELREQVKSAGMTEEAEDKVMKELDRLQQMPPMSAEAGVIRTYVDWFLAMPWSKRTENKIDLDEAERILEEDHYGLQKPKERIVEYLAVLQLVEKLKGPILCFVGPPGVGKTSLGKSIARATGRNFVRMSLGGVRDEAEIRGHRRTYIGALPGRIIQGLRDAKTKNPLFLLDEIDKMSSDFRGDPASALLEVLDPEQNDTFRDHYLDVPFDLSEVMFITTANIRTPIPPALQDRLEVIELPGYTDYEKHKIANLFLIPKQIKEHGLKEKSIQISDGAISGIIHQYTREAGVRNLEREITGICRKVARQTVKAGDKSGPVQIDADDLSDYLGPAKFTRTKAEEQDEVGVATGMVWTQVGGDIVAVEATTMAGDGELTLTGQLQEVMKESAQTALAYIRSRAEQLGVPPDFDFEKNNMHIHVPEGAVPKEGPSAGITIATAMISALTGREVRKDTAMTGEITLRGQVLRIGGLKEKLLAAHRGGVRHVVIPEDNARDLKEVPDNVKAALDILPVKWMDDVIGAALERRPAPKTEDGPEPGSAPGAGVDPDVPVVRIDRRGDSAVDSVFSPLI
jgi:ATP-dependent Lon protease